MSTRPETIYLMFVTFLIDADKAGSTEVYKDATANMRTAIAVCKTDAYHVIRDYEHPDIGRIVELESDY